MKNFKGRQSGKTVTISYNSKLNLVIIGNQHKSNRGHYRRKKEESQRGQRSIPGEVRRRSILLEMDLHPVTSVRHKVFNMYFVLY